MPPYRSRRIQYAYLLIIIYTCPYNVMYEARVSYRYRWIKLFILSYGRNMYISITDTIAIIG